jgi:uncharacterized protein
MTFKPSFYNILQNHPEAGWVLYNSLTGALVGIEEQYIKLFQLDRDASSLSTLSMDVSTLSVEHQNILKELNKGGFVVAASSSTDCELQWLKYLSLRSRFSNSGNTFTLLPTLDCNLACNYCYEEHPSDTMSTEVQDKILEIIQKRSENERKPIHIAWYGGEPLLCLDIIESISRKTMEIAKKHDVTFTAMMISNGYLLTQDTVKLLKELHVQRIQITLDGSPEKHNQYRKHKNGNDTFWTILDHIDYASSHIPIVLRINVDKNNATSLNEVLDIMDQRNFQNKQISPYLGFIKPYTKTCKHIELDCLSEREFVQFNTQFLDTLDQRGYKAVVYPMPAHQICGAVNEGPFVVTPDGSLHKCWATVGIAEEAVGHILAKEGQEAPPLHQQNYLKWMSYDPFEFFTCKTCKIFPICFGGCPNDRVPHPDGKVEKMISCSSYKQKDYLLKILDLARIKQERGDFQQKTEEDTIISTN